MSDEQPKQEPRAVITLRVRPASIAAIKRVAAEQGKKPTVWMRDTLAAAVAKHDAEQLVRNITRSKP